MTIWIGLTAVAFAGLTYFWSIPVSAAEATSVRVHLRPRGPWKNRVLAWLHKTRYHLPGYGAAVRLELDVLQQPPLRYLQEMAGFSGGTAILLGVDVSSWAIPFGLVAGIAMARLYLKWRYQRWLQLCTTQVGELVTLLKARMQAGDTVTRSMVAVAPQLMPPLANEWQRALSALQSGQSLFDVLAECKRRMPDRDIAAVLSQLVIYDRDSIPNDPFGTLAGHLTRMKLLKREYAVRRATGGLTLFEGLAFLGAVLSVGIPLAYLFWTHSLSNGFL